MDKNQSIEEKARALSEPLLNEAGFDLWDVIFEKEGAMSYLRILFDKDGGIDDGDCERMTAPLNALMDKQDFVKHVDILEIGSPGLTRRLRRHEHFEKSTGKPVRVMKRGDKGKAEVIYGTLCAYHREGNEFSLDTGGDILRLQVKNCLKINIDL